MPSSRAGGSSASLVAQGLRVHHGGRTGLLPQGAAAGGASQHISEVLLDPETMQLGGTRRISGAMSLY